MRLVLDTNVVASAILWGGTPQRLLYAAREQRIELFTSTPLLAELTDILGRRKFEKKIAAKAELIVTGDRSLRSLREYQSVKFVRARDAVQALGIE